VVLRALSFSNPGAAELGVSSLPPSVFVPQQRRMESVFVGREGVMGLSGDRAADSRLVSVRTESRAALPWTATSVGTRRSTRLSDSQFASAPPQDAAAVEVRPDLDLFDEGRAVRDKHQSENRPSQSESREDAPVLPSSESSTRAGFSRTAPEFVPHSESVSVAVVPEVAAVSGLVPRKQVSR